MDICPCDVCISQPLFSPPDNAETTHNKPQFSGGLSRHRELVVSAKSVGLSPASMIFDWPDVKGQSFL